MYQKNFKQGFDVERFRWGMVVLGGFLGALVGAILGFGLDRLGERWWGPPAHRPWRGGEFGRF